MQKHEIDVLINGINYRKHERCSEYTRCHDDLHVAYKELKLQTFWVFGVDFLVHTAYYRGIIVYVSIEMKTECEQAIEVMIDNERINLHDIGSNLSMLGTRQEWVYLKEDIRVGIHTSGTYMFMYDILNKLVIENIGKGTE